MSGVLEQLKRIVFVIAFLFVLLLNGIIQSPRFLTNEEDYINIVELANYYRIANLTVNMDRPYYSLTRLANETAKYYFYTVNSPTAKDIARLDGLRAMSAYWGKYVWKDKTLIGISQAIQGMNDNPSTSAMQLLDYTDTDKAMFKIEVYDACFTIRFKDKAFYLIIQLIGLLAFVSLLYLFILNLQPKEDIYSDIEEEDYDGYVNKNGEQTDRTFADESTILQIKMDEAERELSSGIREIVNDEIKRRTYFTQL